MADAVSVNVSFSGTKRHIVVLDNLSDGTGESAVQKVDISTLDGSPSSVRICNVWYSVAGMTVQLMFDHTTNDNALLLTGNGHMNFGHSPIKDPGSAGGTGDILITTLGAGANDKYCLVLELVW